MLNFGESKVAGRDEKARMKCKLIPSTHTNLAFVPAQMSGSQPLKPNFWSFQEVSFQKELTLHPQSIDYNGHQPTRGFWVHFEKWDFV